MTGRSSSGCTGLVLATLARATQAGEIAGHVDATACLGPSSTEEAGIALERLLRIHCGEPEHAIRRKGRLRSPSRLPLPPPTGTRQQRE